MTTPPVLHRGGGVGRRPPADSSTTAPGQDESAEQLAVLARGGSTQAFTRLVERFQEPLCSFLRATTSSPSDAEELAQEAFLRAWRYIGRYDESWRFSTWLFTLAKRLSISRMRKRRHPTVGEEVLAEAAGPHDPARLASAREQRENVWRLASLVLSDEQRAALWMRYAEDLPARDIARVLRKREATVRVILFRARERLARHLEDPPEEPVSDASPTSYFFPPLPAKLAGGPS